MKRMLAVTVSLALGAVAVGGAAQQTVSGKPDARLLGKVVESVEDLNALRSGLAGAFSGEPDRATFAEVCRPVGEQARRLAEENGWNVQQLALKYRNPAHQLDDEAKRIQGLFLQEPELLGVWVRSEMDGRRGLRYFRRIEVEKACLACHGERERRPAFIKEGYPDDRAYGFEVGDLRGVYAVFVPN